jgi:heptosyltransferase-1
VATRYAVFLHGTARREKQWPEAHWIKLGQALGGEMFLPWGSDPERHRSERIAAQVTGARVPQHAPLDQVARLIAGAQYVVGVDTGLMHLAAALGVPLVAIFTGSRPDLTGPVGTGPLRVLGDNGLTPSVDDVIDAVATIVR